jgi:hypothetical protein
MYSRYTFVIVLKGSGKTFTLTGGARVGPGVLQMAAEQLMASVSAGNAAGHAGRYSVYVTAGEIYMETLLDLATAGGKSRKLTAATLQRNPIESESAEGLIRTIEGLARRRAEGATNKNEHSSRSHAVYCIHLEYRVPRDAAALRVSPPPPFLVAGAPESPEVTVMSVGTFGIVDLGETCFSSRACFVWPAVQCCILSCVSFSLQLAPSTQRPQKAVKGSGGWKVVETISV